MNSQSTDPLSNYSNSSHPAIRMRQRVVYFEDEGLKGPLYCGRSGFLGNFEFHL